MLLAQNITEIITVLAIALISIIFAVYLMILKKNGWLGEKSDFYRCPNQKCKKIFQKPIEVKDLSENPPRTYPACPECGANLDTFAFNHKKTLKTRENSLIHNSEPEIKRVEKKPQVHSEPEIKRVEKKPQVHSEPEIKRVEKKPQVHSEPEIKRVEKKPQVHSEPEIKRVEKKPQVHSEPEIKRVEKKPQERRIDAPKLSQSQGSTSRERNLVTKPITDQKKTNVTNNSGCKYYFGYLASRDKKEEIPDTCLECPKNLDCMLSKYKSKDTVVEISKWYQATA
jgi:hypothetical protein